MLLFFQWGSDRVEIANWNANRARIHCVACGRESWMDGFTVSEFDPGRLLAALVDRARKQRKRTPEEPKRIEQQRQTR